MDKLKNILIKHNYLQQDNLYVKNKKAYISQIELNEIDDIYVSFIVKRIYKSKVIEVANEKRKKNKFINTIEKAINDESNLIINDSNLFHCTISCNKCKEIIVDRINSYLFCDIEGFVYIHGIENGRCVVAIDKETAIIILKHLQTMINCSECTIACEPILESANCINI